MTGREMYDLWCDLESEQEDAPQRVAWSYLTDEVTALWESFAEVIDGRVDRWFGS